jgi:eukaryotic-like serine/threonine-protein kinase
MSNAASPIVSLEPLQSSAFRLQSPARMHELLDDRYEIQGFMDSGGTSEIYLALDRRLDRFVVIKQLTAELADNPEVRRRFLHEAAAAHGIEHPNVVKVETVVEPEDQPPFLVMEALVGETLGDLLRREERLPVPTVLRLVREIATALAATHAAGVVHRDVKPDNIFLVGPQGAPEGLKLIDFGMAKLKTVPCSGIVLGTVHYMAPEQVLVEPVDGRTDVYGLGVVMFRMLTGHLPFESEPRADMLRHQLFSAAPPASWLCDELDPTVDAIVLKAMRKHPENRYPSMLALLDDVLAAIDAEPERASSPGLVVAPDRYRPNSEQGAEAFKLLARKFGSFVTGANDA